MRGLRARSVGAIGLAAGLTAGSLAGCNNGPQAPHGSPVLLAVYWVASGAATTIYESDPDASVASVVPGAGAEVDFVFDRRLDGTRIEDNTGDAPVPKANPPITVHWSIDPADPVPTAPPFADVFYSSTSAFGGQTAYAFLRPRLRGFPSTTAVTFVLDKTGLTSAYGELMEGPGEISTLTDAMTVRPPPSSSTDALEAYPPTFIFPAHFTNRPGPVAALAPFAHARASGTELPIALAVDVADPTLVYISPAACRGGWPAGATVEVTFASGLPDAFGVPTTAALNAGSFLVAGAAAAGDAGSAGSCPGPAPTDIDAGAN